MSYTRAEDIVSDCVICTAPQIKAYICIWQQPAPKPSRQDYSHQLKSCSNGGRKLSKNLEVAQTKLTSTDIPLEMNKMWDYGISDFGRG